MMPMMNTANWSFGLSALWGLHILSVIAFSVGLLFFIVFALKHFHATELKTWAIWLMVIGTIVCLITIVLSPPIGRQCGGFGFGGPMSGKAGMMRNMERMMQMMTEHDKKSPNADHEEMEMMLEEMKR